MTAPEIEAPAPTYVRDENDLYGRTSTNLDAICERLAGTHDSLAEILASNPEFPSKWLFLQWMRKDNLAATQYARARLDQADAFEEEIINVLREEPGRLATGGMDGAEVSRQRLRVDSLKWLAAKRAPKKYGDREAGPTVINNNNLIVNTEAERLRLIERRKRALQAPRVVEIDNVTQERSCKVDGTLSGAVETDPPSADGVIEHGS